MNLKGIGNTAQVCVECTNTRHNAWQEENKNLTIEPGMYVKRAFNQGKQTEHMWVKVTEVQGNVITGKLDNDPIYLTNVKCDDIITFDRSEIEQHM